jgi:hypothetical protein
MVYFYRSTCQGRESAGHVKSFIKIDRAYQAKRRHHVRKRRGGKDETQKKQTNAFYLPRMSATSRLISSASVDNGMPEMV